MTIEMFSKKEYAVFGLIFFGALIFVIVVILLKAIAPVFKEMLQEKMKKRTDQKAKKNDDLIVFVSDNEFYDIARKALEAQDLLEFKCYMNGIDKIIHILKDGR